MIQAWEDSRGVWLLIGGFALLAIVTMMALNVGGTRSDVEKVALNGATYMGLGVPVPKPEPADWPDRVIPYSEQPPSFVTPEFPPLPAARPDPDGEEPVVINKSPPDWRPPFWQAQQRDGS